MELKLTPGDILMAAAAAMARSWSEPTTTVLLWTCDLYDPAGNLVTNGDANTPSEAMALAWLAAIEPDALITAKVPYSAELYDVPPGWRFEVRRRINRT